MKEPLRKPTTGVAACCARAAKGKTVAPPINAMNSRRIMRSPRRCDALSCPRSFELITDDCNRLDFNKKVRVGEILGSNQHARRELTLDELTTNLNELIPVRLIADHYG